MLEDSGGRRLEDSGGRRLEDSGMGVTLRRTRKGDWRFGGFDVRGGKQVRSYFGQEPRQTQENWDQALGSLQGSDPAATIVA